MLGDVRIKFGAAGTEHHISAQSLRERIKHFIAAGALTCFRKLDTRIDEILLELLRMEVGAVRRADAVAQNAAEHQPDRCSDRTADDGAGRRAAEHTHALFLRELVLARVRRAGSQRNSD